MDINDIIDATENAETTRDSNVNSGMAFGLEKDAVKASETNGGGLHIASQLGTGNGTCGLADGMAVHIFAENGAVGTRRTVMDLFRELGLDWTYVVREIPAMLEGFAHNTNAATLKALYRSDTGALMNVVGTDFSTDLAPGRIAEIWQEAIDKVREKSGADIFPDRILEMNKGREHMLQTVTGTYETPRGKLQGRLTLQTGYSGSSAHKGCISPIAAVCQNTYRAALSNAVSVRHSANAGDKISDAVLSIVSGEQQIQDLIRWQEQAEKIHVTKAMLEQAAMAMFPSAHTRFNKETGQFSEEKKTGQSEKKREALMNAFEDPYHGAEGKSLLDLAQGITFVTSRWDSVVTARKRGDADPMSAEESLYRGSAGKALDNAYTVLAVASAQNDIDASWMGIAK